MNKIGLRSVLFMWLNGSVVNKELN